MGSVASPQRGTTAVASISTRAASFDETRNLDQRHGGIMGAEQFAIDLAERLQVGQVFLHVDDVPGETNEMIGPRTTLGQNC